MAYICLIDGTKDQTKDKKILSRLIESQWADEIFAQPIHNLSENNWNKNELLSFSSYNDLSDVLYCQIILLNRRRPVEVAQLKVIKHNAIICNLGIKAILSLKTI